MEAWNSALKKYHSAHPNEKFTIPKRGTAKYDAVIKMAGLEPKPVKASRPKKVPMCVDVEGKTRPVEKPAKAKRTRKPKA
jgi:hypothetical protein